MKRFKTVSLAVSVILCVSMLAGCGGNTKEASSSTPASSAPASSAPTSAAPEKSTTPAQTVSKTMEGLSEETIAYLDGKDFKGQTLVVGVWGGDYEAILRETVIPVLEEKGARIELLLGGAGDRVAKLYAEKSNPSMDIAYINIHTAAQGVVDGIVEKADSSLPVYKDLYDYAKESGGYGAAVSPVGIQYNKDAFPTPPTWEDLFRPEFKGKIAFPTFPSTGGDALLGVIGRMLGGDEHDTDKVIEKLKELKPVPLVYTSNDELGQYMDQGIVVAAANISSYAQALSDRYSNVGFVFTEVPGSVIAMDVLCIVSGTKNRDLALAYTQVALDPRTQTAFAEKAYFGPTNSKVKLSSEVSAKVIDTPDEVKDLLQLDWPFIVQARKDLAEKWNKELIED